MIGRMRFHLGAWGRRLSSKAGHTNTVYHTVGKVPAKRGKRASTTASKFKLRHVRVAEMMGIHYVHYVHYVHYALVPDCLHLDSV